MRVLAAARGTLVGFLFEWPRRAWTSFGIAKILVHPIGQAEGVTQFVLRDAKFSEIADRDAVAATIGCNVAIGSCKGRRDQVLGVETSNE